MSHVKPWQICAVATVTLAAMVPAVPAVSAGSGEQYANQTPYGNPKDTSVRKAPTGYSMFFIETVGRHGARSLVDDGPEQAALRIWKKAEEKKALTATGTTLARDIKRFQDAERGIGYGNLSGLGRDEMHGIGRRTADNYPSFFSAIRKKSETIATVTTDVTRTKQSASSLRDGLEDGFGRSLDSLLAKPVEANDLMRFSWEGNRRKLPIRNFPLVAFFSITVAASGCSSPFWRTSLLRISNREDSRTPRVFTPVIDCDYVRVDEDFGRSPCGPNVGCETEVLTVRRWFDPVRSNANRWIVI